MKYIKNYHLRKKKINKNILIVGSGRWARVYISEIFNNFNKIKTIFVFTNYSENLKRWAELSKINNIVLIKKFSEIKKIDCKYVIITTKNEKNYSLVKKFLLLDYFILVEKPFHLTLKNFDKLNFFIKNRKKKIFLSSQFFFAAYLYYLKNKIIKKNNILKIIIQWFDKPNEKRHGMIKNQNFKVSFNEDIFYHIYSILFIFLGNWSIKIKKKEIPKKNFYKFFLNFNTCEVLLNSSRMNKSRKRILKFYLKNKKVLYVNFSNDNRVILKINNVHHEIPKIWLQKTLKFQILNFIENKKIYSKKIINYLENLRNLYLSIEELKRLR